MIDCAASRDRDECEPGPFVASRSLQRGQERRREPAKLRFTHEIVPKANKPKQKIERMEIFAVERVEQAVEYCRGV